MYLKVKRFFDIFLSSILIIILLPLFLSIVLILLFSAEGEIFYLQKRIGFKNTEFETPKFISNEFGIWLIGYDGSIKDYSKDDKIFLRLFNLIDSMPMRQNEIKKDKC